MTFPLLAAAACLALAPEAERITAHDLAPAWPALAALPASTEFGYAPSPGVQRYYRGEELARLAARYNLAPVAGSICVERAGAVLDRDRLQAAMHRTLPEARIEILEFSRGPVPAGPLEFPRTGLQAGGRWSGYIRYGRERRFLVWARVKLTVRVVQVVAVEPLRAGRPVADAQVRLDIRDGNPPGESVLTATAEAVGRLPRKTIAAGAVLTRNLLAEAPDVARGEAVKVTVVQGGARLEMEAMAEADGRRGERINLRNPESGRRFTAKVTGKGRAAIGVVEETK